VTIYVSVRTYERRLLWNNDVLLREHDGCVLSNLGADVRIRLEF
jgi:hypothetical protein